ncbi:MAG: hypothetical protein J6X16_05550, partial [Bacteroidales bacterium]|nr:hypothetical protein [Bacteroidales bacterium]
TYPLILGGLILVWFCYGMSTVVVYTTAMDNVRVGREGTDFTVQTVITHLSGLLMSLISGKVADLFGYHDLFLFEASIALFTVVYVFLMFKKNKEQSATQSQSRLQKTPIFGFRLTSVPSPFLNRSKTVPRNRGKSGYSTKVLRRQKIGIAQLCF